MSRDAHDGGTAPDGRAGRQDRYCPSCEQSFRRDTERCPRDGDRLVDLSAPADPFRGIIVDGRFTVHERIGGGGMGSVYRATQHSVGRDVAIKFVEPRLREHRAAARRFLREARLASRLRHTNVVGIIDFGRTDRGALYLVMEMLRGRTLSEVLSSDAPLPPVRAVQLIEQISRALAAAHADGIVHRDLKPSNIMVLDEHGRDLVKVLDFGLAKVQGESSDTTDSDQLVGTPSYMPPEMALAGTCDARGDLYALGVILYEMLAGRHPFEAETPREMVSRHIHFEVPSLPDTVPVHLAALVRALLAKDPAARPPDAAAVLARLHERASAPAPVEVAPDPVETLTMDAPRGEHVVTAAAPRRVWRVAALTAVALTAIALLVWSAARSGEDERVAPDAGGRAFSTPVAVPVDARSAGPAPRLNAPVAALPDATPPNVPVAQQFDAMPASSAAAQRRTVRRRVDAAVSRRRPARVPRIDAGLPSPIVDPAAGPQADAVPGPGEDRIEADFLDP